MVEKCEIGDLIALGRRPDQLDSILQQHRAEKGIKEREVDVLDLERVYMVVSEEEYHKNEDNSTGIINNSDYLRFGHPNEKHIYLKDLTTDKYAMISFIESDGDVSASFHKVEKSKKS